MNDHAMAPELPFDSDVGIAHTCSAHRPPDAEAAEVETPDGPGDTADLDISIRLVRSSRRRKTVQARLVGGVVELRIPAGMTDAEAERYRDDLVPRLLRRAKSDQVDLTERAQKLAGTYGFPQPASVRWVSNQHSRWGSCTVDDATIRISNRLVDFPHWVLDYVLVHELAHLIEPNHSAAFHDLVARYPKAERATGFLIAKGLEAD